MKTLRLVWEYKLQASSLYPAVATLSVLSLLFSVFVLPIGYTFNETCPGCQGRGTVACETCKGSGKCWVCGGDGIIDYMPPGDQWCAACQGTGRCYVCVGEGWHACKECGGNGLLVHWMYTLTGSAIVLSIVNVLLFMGLFVLAYVGSAFYLSFNEWVYEVEDMGFWFNRSFMTWLFAKHRRRWAKWQIGINSILGIYLGALLFGVVSLKQITGESFAEGTLLSIVFLGLFSLLFYKSYTSRLEASS